MSTDNHTIVLIDFGLEHHLLKTFGNKLRFRCEQKPCFDFSGKFEYVGSLGNSLGLKGSDIGEFNLCYDVKISYFYDLLLVSDHSNFRIQAFGLNSLKFEFVITLPTQPRCLATDIYDRLLIGGGDECLYLYDISCRERVWWRGLKGSPGSSIYQFNGISSMVVNKNRSSVGYGNIGVCDSGNSRIKVLSRDGDFLFSFGKKESIPMRLQTPIGIDLNHMEQYVITDAHNHCMLVTTRRGEVIHRLGKRGDGGEGEFQYPGCLSIDPTNNHIIVCDDWNNRICVYSSSLLELISVYKETSLFRSELYPGGICVDKWSGRLFLVNREQHQVVIFK